MQERATHNIPNQKINMTAIFFLAGILRVEMTGSGKQSTIKSKATLDATCATPVATTSYLKTPWPVQDADIGLLMKSTS